MDIRINQTHRPHKPSRPGEETVAVAIRDRLRAENIPDAPYFHDLLSMWQEAIDMGMAPEAAREKLDETLRGVVTYHRLTGLASNQRRQMINALFSHMSMEIKTHVAMQPLPETLTTQERRTQARQDRDADDPGRNLAEENAERGHIARSDHNRKHRGSPPRNRFLKLYH